MLGRRVQAAFLDCPRHFPYAHTPGNFRVWPLNRSERVSPQGEKNQVAVDGEQDLPTGTHGNPGITLECRLAEKAVRFQDRPKFPFLVIGESGAGKEAFGQDGLRSRSPPAMGRSSR